MEPVLNNPVYHALLSGDARLGFGRGQVRCFDVQVSPFAGFPEDYDKGFDDLYDLLPSERKILYATPRVVKEPVGWQMMQEIKGLQFIFTVETPLLNSSQNLVPLNEKHVPEMVELATLTRPGPFGLRTIEFGHYYGIFDDGRLVAMAGQRLHVEQYTEISAVCTHPDYLGRGFAAALIQHQLHLISSHSQKAFLHVRADNERAIALYHRLGFEISRPMNFYFLKRRLAK